MAACTEIDMLQELSPAGSWPWSAQLLLRGGNQNFTVHHTHQALKASSTTQIMAMVQASPSNHQTFLMGILLILDAREETEERVTARDDVHCHTERKSIAWTQVCGQQVYLSVRHLQQT
jgi:hypothetical protein